MALIALLALILLALLRRFTIPSVSHRDLVSLVRLVRTFLHKNNRCRRMRGNVGSLAKSDRNLPTSYDVLHS
jgi:hypothetical protein